MKKKKEMSPMEELLQSGSTQKVIQEMASVTDNTKEDEEEYFNSVNLYKVPKAWVEVIKRHGFSFVGFAKIAIKERIEKLGLK